MVTAVESSTIGRGPRIFGASVTGQLHIQSSLPCQDACAYRVLPSGVIVIAVADGLGSAPFSEVGARVVVEAAVAVTAEWLDSVAAPVASLENSVRAAVAAGRKALDERSVAESCKLRDLACTLILAVMQEHGLGVAHIGDGAVVGEVEGSLRLISAPGESEFTNEVVPITSADWEEHLRIVSLPSRVGSIAVFTDGCQRAAFRKSEAGLEPFDGFFRPIFEYARDLTDLPEGVQELEALLNSSKICENSDDDKTLVIGVMNSG